MGLALGPQLSALSSGATPSRPSSDWTGSLKRTRTPTTVPPPLKRTPAVSVPPIVELASVTTEASAVKLAAKVASALSASAKSANVGSPARIR